MDLSSIDSRSPSCSVLRSLSHQCWMLGGLNIEKTFHRLDYGTLLRKASYTLQAQDVMQPVCTDVAYCSHVASYAFQHA